MCTRLTNCNLIDCVGGQELQPNMLIQIENGRITGVFPSDKAPDWGGPTIDMEGDYVVPGLWEVHTHIGDLIPDPQNRLETEHIAEYVIRAGRNVFDGLRKGIVGIRLVGEEAYVGIGWRKAFQTGVFLGPRIFSCCKAISATGGHGHGTLGALEVDGPVEMGKAVRANLAHGADQIKLMVTGGVMTPGETMDEIQLLEDEIRAAVHLAHQAGRKVCVHSWGTEGVKLAIRCGVDSIEHGLLDEECVELMVKNNTFYVPTLQITQAERKGTDSDLPQFMRDKIESAKQRHLEGFRLAVDAGVFIACGSDAAPISEFTHQEIQHLVLGGMSSYQALIAATRTSASLCDALAYSGTIELGKDADIVATTRNPLEDIMHLQQARFVMYKGNVVPIEQPEGTSGFRDTFMR